MTYLKDVRNFTDALIFQVSEKKKKKNSCGVIEEYYWAYYDYRRCLSDYALA